MLDPMTCDARTWASVVDGSAQVYQYIVGNSPAKAASPASMAPPRCPLLQAKDWADRDVTASTGAATAESMRCFTAWPSPSCVAIPEPGTGCAVPRIFRWKSFKCL